VLHELRNCIPVKVHILPAIYKAVELIVIKIIVIKKKRREIPAFFPDY